MDNILTLYASTTGNVQQEAIRKIDNELESFTGNRYATAVSKPVAAVIKHFCEEDERFASVVLQTAKTLTDCCEAATKNCGSSISDIDVYRGVAKAYFPNSDVKFLMELEITGDMPSEAEMSEVPKRDVKKSTTTSTKTAEKKKVSEAKSEAKKKADVMQLSLF